MMTLKHEAPAKQAQSCYLHLNYTQHKHHPRKVSPDDSVTAAHWRNYLVHNKATDYFPHAKEALWK